MEDLPINEATENPRLDREADQINKSFGQIVRRYRRKAGMTLEQLAAVSHVSRAMLSSVERGEKSPTLSVLSGIASGLNVTMSQLMGEETRAAVVTVIRKTERLVFHDRATGIERHLLSPNTLRSGVEVIEHVLPAGQHMAGNVSAGVVTEKYLVVTAGTLTVEVETERHVLSMEDSMHFQTTGHYRFVNESASVSRYYIFILHRDPAN